MRPSKEEDKKRRRAYLEKQNGEAYPPGRAVGLVD